MLPVVSAENNVLREVDVKKPPFSQKKGVKRLWTSASPLAGAHVCTVLSPGPLCLQKPQEKQVSDWFSFLWNSPWAGARPLGCLTGFCWSQSLVFTDVRQTLFASFSASARAFRPRRRSATNLTKASAGCGHAWMKWLRVVCSFITSSLGVSWKLGLAEGWLACHQGLHSWNKCNFYLFIFLFRV